MGDDRDAPKIEFPCDYPIRIIGHQVEGGALEIIETVRKHAPEVSPDEVSSRLSRAGTYQSIRVTIRATGETQLKALHKDLMELRSVKLVL